MCENADGTFWAANQWLHQIDAQGRLVKTFDYFFRAGDRAVAGWKVPPLWHLSTYFFAAGSARRRSGNDSTRSYSHSSRRICLSGNWLEAISDGRLGGWKLRIMNEEL
jgi:hypothetical protein